MPNLIQSKRVVAKDINGQEYEISSYQLSFRPSVYGLIIQDEKILLAKQWDGYYFPGGGVELGETIKEALTREVKEETGLNIKIIKLLDIKDSYFKIPDQDHYVQSILIYFLCLVTGGSLTTEFFDQADIKDSSIAEWIDLKDIKNLKLNSTVGEEDKIIELAENLI